MNDFSLALATAIGAWVNFALILWFGLRAGFIGFDGDFRRDLGKLAVAGVALAIALFVAQWPILAVTAGLPGVHNVMALVLLGFTGALVYAGAMLPKAYGPLESIMEAMTRQPELFSQLEIHFIGTGKTPNDPQGYNIRPLAERYGLWEKVIFEYPARIPYLDVLIHLEAATGVFILGSTEVHYTPSKVYQGVLSRKPIMAVLHRKSSACEVIRSTGAGIVLGFEGEEGVPQIAGEFASVFTEYIRFVEAFSPARVDYTQFDKFSARAVTQQLAELLDKIVAA